MIGINNEAGKLFLTYVFWNIPYFMGLILCFLNAFRFLKIDEKKESWINLSLGLVGLGLRMTPFFFLMYGQIFQFAFRHQVLNISWSPLSFLIYFLAADFWFYMTHRLMHRVPLLWAIHEAHHSGIHMNPTLALRASIFDFIEIVIWIGPLVILGFDPFGLFVCRNLIFIYQFFCHSKQNWPQPLENWIVTPQIHRRHHSATPPSTLGNYGGVLMVWDIIAGTIKPSIEPLKYGLSSGFWSLNPAKILFHGPYEVLVQLRRSRSLKSLFQWNSGSK